MIVITALAFADWALVSALVCLCLNYSTTGKVTHLSGFLYCSFVNSFDLPTIVMYISPSQLELERL